MGRYYSCGDFYEKFGFGCQSSYDPQEVYGMTDEPCYWEDEDGNEVELESEVKFVIDNTSDNRKMVKRQLDKIYKQLGISKSDRVYEVGDTEEVWDLLNKYRDRLWRPIIEGERGGYSFGDGTTSMERRKGVRLGECRVLLGVVIYSTMITNQDSDEIELYADC